MLQPWRSVDLWTWSTSSSSGRGAILHWSWNWLIYFNTQLKFWTTEDLILNFWQPILLLKLYWKINIFDNFLEYWKINNFDNFVENLLFRKKNFFFCESVFYHSFVHGLSQFRRLQRRSCHWLPARSAPGSASGSGSCRIRSTRTSTTLLTERDCAAEEGPNWPRAIGRDDFRNRISAILPDLSLQKRKKIFKFYGFLKSPLIWQA